MKANDFSVPRRMSKSAYVVFFIHALKAWLNFFFLVVVVETFKSDKTVFDKILYLLGLGGVLVVIAAVCAFVNYYFKKYYVEDGTLIFIHGVLHKEVTSMPLHRIQSLRTKQGLIYRLLDMKGVSFDTLASQSEEVEMILDDADWEALLAQIDTLRADEADEGYSPHLVEQGGEESGKATVLKFSNLNLIKGAFCQNHLQGMAILLSVLATLYNELLSVNEEMANYVVGYLDKQADAATITLSSILVLALLLYLGMLLLWMGKVFLRYFNIVVQINQDQLSFESGLISRNSSRFSYDKVSTIHVKQNFLEKLLRCSTVMLQQALNATDEKKGADVRIYGSDSAGYFLNWWLGKDYSSSSMQVSAQSGYGMMGFSVLPKLLIAFAVTLVICYYQWYVGLCLPAFYLFIVLVKDYLAVRRSCIVLKEDYVVVCSGGFAAVADYFKYSNVEVVRLKATPFTPYSRRVSLHLSTNGSSFIVRSLREEEAKAVYELLLSRCNMCR